MQTQLGTTPDPLHQPVDLPLVETPSRTRRAGWLALLLIAPLFWFVLWLIPSLNGELWHDPLFHVLFASRAALLGIVLALLVLRAAKRFQDGRIFLVGMGFLSIASILLIHSIAIPNVLMSGRNAATSWSSVLCLVLGSVFFALSGLDISPALNDRLMRYARLWLTLLLIFWLAYSMFFLVLIPAAPPATAPDQTEHVEENEQPGQAQSWLAIPALSSFPASPDGMPRLILTIIGLGCMAVAIGRHWYLYRRSPSSAGLVIICGIALFAEALLGQFLFPGSYTPAFWLWHTLELAGFGVIAYAVLGAYRRGQTGESLLESLFLTGTRARVQADYAKAMDALVETLSRGEKPIPELRQALRERFGMVEGQMQALEHAAAAVAQERQQRRELEQLNAALHQLEQDKSQLMQMVVHDLKNPLTALVGFLELLRLDRLTEEQCLLVESALRSGKNLSGLISDLLDVGRIEEGHMELERTLLPPRDLLEDCASEMRGWIIQDDKQILIETPDDLPLLQADLRLMHRVILNLISNAIKHTPPGTSIILRAYQATTHEQEPKGQLVIEVADDGPGIPPEYLDRIFDKYGRVNGDHHPRQDSTGLGLTFCRLAIEAHEGSIGVSSVLGQGTTFHLRLPAV